MLTRLLVMLAVASSACAAIVVVIDNESDGPLRKGLFRAECLYHRPMAVSSERVSTVDRTVVRLRTAVLVASCLTVMAFTWVGSMYAATSIAAASAAAGFGIALTANVWKRRRLRRLEESFPGTSNMDRRRTSAEALRQFSFLAESSGLALIILSGAVLQQNVVPIWISVAMSSAVLGPWMTFQLLSVRRQQRRAVETPTFRCQSGRRRSRVFV